MAGNRDSITLSGSLGDLSPTLRDFRWQIMNQGRWRDDSAPGFRFSENQLFAQVGNSLNEHASVWFGYVHDWLHSLDKLSFRENRLCRDFLYNTAFGDWKFTSRISSDRLAG